MGDSHQVKSRQVSGRGSQKVLGWKLNGGRRVIQEEDAKSSELCLIGLLYITYNCTGLGEATERGGDAR